MIVTQVKSKSLSLDEFLAMPETEPASEFIDGEIIQKEMPKGRHSPLQLKLCVAINGVAEEPKIAYALPEFRCTFDNRSSLTLLCLHGVESHSLMREKCLMTSGWPQTG